MKSSKIYGIFEQVEFLNEDSSFAYFRWVAKHKNEKFKLVQDQQVPEEFKEIAEKLIAACRAVYKSETLIYPLSMYEKEDAKKYNNDPYEDVDKLGRTNSYKFNIQVTFDDNPRKHGKTEYGYRNEYAQRFCDIVFGFLQFEKRCTLWNGKMGNYWSKSGDGCTYILSMSCESLLFDTYSIANYTIYLWCAENDKNTWMLLNTDT